MNRDSLRTIVIDGFHNINTRLDKLQMTETQSQTDINNAVTVFTGLFQDLAADNAAILSDLTTLANSSAGGTPPDTTALDAIVAQSQSVQSGLDNAVAQLTTLAAPPVVTEPPVTVDDPTPVESSVEVKAPELANPVGDRGASLMGLAPVAVAPPSDVPPAAPQPTARPVTEPGARSEVANLISTAIDALKAVANKL